MLCCKKGCVDGGEDTTVTKTTNGVAVGVGDVSAMGSEATTARSVKKMQTSSSARRGSEYACGTATLRWLWRSLEFVQGEEGVALRVTSEAAKCRALFYTMQ